MLSLNHMSVLDYKIQTLKYKLKSSVMAKNIETSCKSIDGLNIPYEPLIKGNTLS